MNSVLSILSAVLATVLSSAPMQRPSAHSLARGDTVPYLRRHDISDVQRAGFPSDTVHTERSRDTLRANGAHGLEPSITDKDPAGVLKRAWNPKLANATAETATAAPKLVPPTNSTLGQGRGATPPTAAPAATPAPIPAPAKSPYRIVGYVDGRVAAAKIDPAKLTHINYAFAQVSPAGEIFFQRTNAVTNLVGLRELKKKNPNLKLLVSVGGWGADNFSDAALTEASRKTFAKSAVNLIKAQGIDGIDLDWEYPGLPGPGIKFRPEDKQNFTLLLKEVRAQLDVLSREQKRLDEDRLLLTIATGASQNYFDHTEMESLHVHLDFINVMTYDLFTSGSKTTGHHSGLYPSKNPNMRERTSSAGIDRHLRAGIPPEKIVLGTAFYGRAWAGVDPKDQGLNQPFEKFVDAIPYSRLVDQYINKNGFRRFWDGSAMAPFLWNPESRTFISYDDPESLRHKARYIREKGLGGVMYWQHGHDPSQVLLRTLHENLRP